MGGRLIGRFRLDPRGQLVPQDKEAEGALPSRAGDYELIPTAPDLLCMLRRPPSGGRASPPRVVLSGDPSGFPLADLIGMLSQSRWSGVVSVHEPTAQRSIAMKEGEVRGATSDEASERLGEVMVRLGYVQPQQLEEILKEHPPSRLGRALVDRGILQSHDLWKCINHQVAQIFHAMVLCKEGAFLLLDQPLDEKGQNIQVSVQSLLMDSLRQIDEMAHFRKRIPHGRLFVAKKRASDGTLEKEEDQVLGLANGERTVLALGTAAKLSEFDVTKIVFRLLEGGFATVSEHRIAAAAPAAQAPQAQPGKPAQAGNELQKVIHTFNLIYQDIVREVSKHDMQKELLASANAALQGKGLSASPVLVGLSFGADGKLPEAKLAEQFERMKAQLGSEPVATVRQALSDVMFFMLFQAGELLETAADEELATRVKAMLAVLDEA